MPRGIEIVKPGFRKLLKLGAKLRPIATGMAFAEGTVWWGRKQSLIWSDIPNNRLMQWSPAGGVRVLRTPSGNSNGNTVDLSGNLLSCETSGRCVTQTTTRGQVRTLVDRYSGLRFNSPNDIVVKSDGSVWFTDPDYGILHPHPDLGHGKPREVAGNYVYRYEPETGRLDVVADDFQKPNGLAFSPDEKRLYIGDSGRTHDAKQGNHHVRVFAVAAGGRKLRADRVFAAVEPHVPDGMRVDAGGNLFVTAGDGVQVFDPGGDLIGKIHTPEVAANCAFGGRGYSTLFIAATSSVWAIELNTAGATRT
jgi:gluconolactonase